MFTFEWNVFCFFQDLKCSKYELKNAEACGAAPPCAADFFQCESALRCRTTCAAPIIQLTSQPKPN